MPHLSTDAIRAQFSAAMSSMYRKEVPAYGTLLDLVAEVNAQVLEADRELALGLAATDNLARLSEERHGAIRLGTAQELQTMARVFAVMGMEPVSYYDLSGAGIPVHSTAFRPVSPKALSANPFRVFTSLLRLELIEDASLRGEAERILEGRQIFTPALLELLDQAEAHGGLDAVASQLFVDEALKTFKWHPEALVDRELYGRLHSAHRLIADVVSFKGPHINHLTPRTLDIDRSQALMPQKGIAPKAVVEGPPARKNPLLLRQTSFKALEEKVLFEGQSGSHTARFGEIEQRGAALTPKGRALYDRFLADVLGQISPAADGSNAARYEAVLAEVFADFPDSAHAMEKDGLAYFRSLPDDKSKTQALVYEDFLPVSAAGIFQSNLGDKAATAMEAEPNKPVFETSLGRAVQDEFALYAEQALQA